MRCQSSLLIVVLLIAMPFLVTPQAQDSPLPSGPLVFRSSGLEFRADRTYRVESVVEGMGTVRAGGRWIADVGELALTGYELAAGRELLEKMSIPLDGCDARGVYRYEIQGRQIRLSVVGDECVPRRLFLDKSRWAPPGEPNLTPPRSLARTMFDPAVGLPPPADPSGSWPSFRGPNASGVADGQQLPDRWNVSTGENVLWRTRIPGLGHSSPIVWGDRLFVTSAVSSRADATFKTGPYGGGESSEDTSRHRWVLFALDGATGRIVWQQDAFAGTPRDKRHVKSTYASSTPATDGRVVVAWFGSQGLHAYTIDGRPLWKVDPGRVSVGAAESAVIEWGPASSPVIWDGLVILQVDTQDDSFLVALRAETGEQVWKTERDEGSSWSTPTVVTTKDGAELVVNGSTSVRGYDPRTGTERWRIAAGSPIATPTPVVAGSLSIIASGGMGSNRPIIAVRDGATGDLTPALSTDSKTSAGLAWHHTGRGPFTVTPIAYRGLLYVLANNGVLDAYELETGTEVYRARVPAIVNGVSASPVAADGKIYVSGEDGAIAVLAAGRTFRQVATNDMGEPLMATPALSRGVMYVRGMNTLFAIGERR